MCRLSTLLSVCSLGIVSLTSSTITACSAEHSISPRVGAQEPGTKAGLSSQSLLSAPRKGTETGSPWAPAMDPWALATGASCLYPRCDGLTSQKEGLESMVVTGRACGNPDVSRSKVVKRRACETGQLWFQILLFVLEQVTQPSWASHAQWSTWYEACLCWVHSQCLGPCHPLGSSEGTNSEMTTDHGPPEGHCT